MKITIIALAVIMLYSAVSAVELDLHKHWDDFKSKHTKKYSSEAVEYLRRAIFFENARKIIEHNLKSENSFRLAINEFADLTGVEFKNLMLGSRKNTALLGRKSNATAQYMSPLNYRPPASVDWRTKGYVTPVKNQGQCGSCWAFSTTGSLEGQHFRKTGRLVNLSEEQLVDCSVKYGNHGCNGGLMDNAFKYIKANGGLDTESSYPYRARQGKCHFNQRNIGATVRGFVDVQQGNENALKVACAANGPISVAIDASHFTFQFYYSGVYDEPNCSSTQLDHGVLVAGYGTLNGADYWLVKNSWGPSWGLQGYIKMSRNRNNQCGIASSASFPLV